MTITVGSDQYKRVRRSLLALCRDCTRGRICKNGALQDCPTCHGTGQVERWIVEVVHEEDEQERTNPVQTVVSSAASSIAMALLRQRHDEGYDIHIPSLGITIPGDAGASVARGEGQGLSGDS